MDSEWNDPYTGEGWVVVGAGLEMVHIRLDGSEAWYMGPFATRTLLEADEPGRGIVLEAYRKGLEMAAGMQ